MAINYRQYIHSAGWRALCNAKLFEANYKCEKCGRDDGKLDVHHKTYERLGDERMSDLIVLCRYCHKVSHGLIVFHGGWTPE
jgi:hypothetical protein